MRSSAVTRLQWLLDVLETDRWPLGKRIYPHCDLGHGRSIITPSSCRLRLRCPLPHPARCRLPLLRRLLLSLRQRGHRPLSNDQGLWQAFWDVFAHGQSYARKRKTVSPPPCRACACFTFSLGLSRCSVAFQAHCRTDLTSAIVVRECEYFPLSGPEGAIERPSLALTRARITV